MKKYVKSAFVAAIVAVSGYNIYQSQSVMNGMSEFALANVEALADGESSYDYPDGMPFTFVCGVTIESGIFFDDECSATVVECKGGGLGCNERPCPTHG